MNINLDKQSLRKYKHGKILDNLYTISLRWVDPESLHIPYELDKGEVRQARKAIKDNRRQDPVIVLQDIGIVAGIHNLQAYKDLKFDRIPILYGKLK